MTRPLLSIDTVIQSGKRRFRVSAITKSGVTLLPSLPPDGREIQLDHRTVELMLGASESGKAAAQDKLNRTKVKAAAK